MPVYDRSKLNELLKKVSGGDFSALLVFGERSLCQQAAEQVCAVLCARGGLVHSIDGDGEEHGVTLAKLRSFSLLGGRQVFRVNGSRLFLSKNVSEALWKKAVKAWEEGSPDKAAKQLRAMLAAAGLDCAEELGSLSEELWKKHFGFARPSGSLDWTGPLLSQQSESAAASSSIGDAGDQLLSALESGLPKSNVLLLLAEEVDKRKKLYKSFSAKYDVLDMSVDAGSSNQARKEQDGVLREQIGKTLNNLGKTLDRDVMEQLLERVGFHPGAAVMELEKLALFAGDATRISLDDLNLMVGRTREDAVFELTEAVGGGNLDKALLVASRLLENGIHGLAALAALRNFARSLLLFRALQEQEQHRFRSGMPPNVFQEQCLPLLRANPRWQAELSGHPFALYMKFKTASAFSLPRLKFWLSLLLVAERRLKGSAIPADIVIQHLVLAMTSTTSDKGNLQNSR